MELLTEVLAGIEQTAMTGFGLIEADAESLALMIAKISGFAVLLNALISPREFSMTQPIGLLISLYAVGFLMTYFQPITASLLEMMERVGLAAGGDTVTLKSLKDVGAVAAGGWTAAGPLLAALHETLDWDFYKHIDKLIFYIPCIAILLILHIVLAFRIFFMYLEYFVIATVAYFLLPTAVWRRTTYLAERAIGYVVAVGISLLVTGFLYSLVHQYVASIAWDADMPVMEMVGATATTYILLVAVILSGRAVRALQYGAPNMSDNGAIIRVASAAGMMWTAARTGGAVMAMGMRGGTAAIRETTSALRRLQAGGGAVDPSTRRFRPGNAAGGGSGVTPSPVPRPSTPEERGRKVWDAFVADYGPNGRMRR